MARCMHAMGHLQDTLSDHPGIQQVDLQTHVEPVFALCPVTITADLLSTSNNLDTLVSSGPASARSVASVQSLCNQDVARLQRQNVLQRLNSLTACLPKIWCRCEYVCSTKHCHCYESLCLDVIVDMST